MRFLRWSFLMALSAGCADLSGLSGLEVGDGAVEVDATSDAPAGDASTIDSPAEGGSDSGIAVDGDASVTSTFCQTESGYIFCADFDEGDVGVGFSGGKPAKWSSAPGATLDTARFYSSPASAGLQGTGVRFLLWTGPSNTQVTTLGVQARMRVSGAAQDNATVLVVQLDSSHVVEAVLMPGQNGFAVRINERDPTASDGGGVTSAHDTNAVVNEGTWTSMSLQVQGLTINYAFGASTGSVPRTGGGSFTQPAVVLGMGTDWAGNIDNAVIAGL